MSDENLEVFSQRVKELRLKLGLTQKAFASNIGITSSALSSYEKKGAIPSLEVAKKIAIEYHVSTDWLCGLTDNPAGGVTLADCLKQPNGFQILRKNVENLNHTVARFAHEREKMRAIVKDGIMDQELYSQWEEKALKDYNYPIAELFTIPRNEE